jgi:hypothetical protein
MKMSGQQSSPSAADLSAIDRARQAHIAALNQGDVDAWLLILATPAGLEQFVIEAGEPGTDRSSPPTAPPDMDKLMQAAARHQIDILGPLPE